MQPGSKELSFSGLVSVFALQNVQVSRSENFRVARDNLEVVTVLFLVLFCNVSRLFPTTGIISLGVICILIGSSAY